MLVSSSRRSCGDMGGGGLAMAARVTVVCVLCAVAFQHDATQVVA
jgi:hypothetical protein